MLIPFDQILLAVDGHIIAKTNIALRNITVAAGVMMASTLMVSGTEIGNLTNCDLDCVIEDRLSVIVGFHPSEIGEWNWQTIAPGFNPCRVSLR